MNTPAHVVLNLALYTGRERKAHAPFVFWGALLPDLPMLFFYGWERSWMGVPERLIWSTQYFQPHWQDFFDLFNSVPLTALVLVGCYAAGRSAGAALCASMLLHQLTDLPLHREDAHRHFFPFTDFRFESPVSYWDPAHHGAAGSLLEVAVVLAGVAVLWRRFPRRGPRAALAGLAALYVAAWVAFYGLGGLAQMGSNP